MCLEIWKGLIVLKIEMQMCYLKITLNLFIYFSNLSSQEQQNLQYI